MATRTKAAAQPLADEAPPPEVKTGPAISGYRVVWVVNQGVPEANGRTGYVRVLKAVAQAMIDRGDAQDPYGKVPLKNIKSANVYTPPAPPPPAPPPPAEQPVG